MYLIALGIVGVVFRRRLGRWAFAWNYGLFHIETKEEWYRIFMVVGAIFSIVIGILLLLRVIPWG